MPGWAIALIVIGSILLSIVISSSIIFIYAGKQMVKNMSRESQGFSNIKMDISFYKNGPVAKLAEEGVKYLQGLPYQDIYITSFDNIKLHAYLFKNPNGATLGKYFLGMHGFKSGPLHEYAPYVKYWFDLGFDVVLPDERAHYKSGGQYLTMGVKERYDVLYWAKYLVNTYGDGIQIIIQGISMGGASVCMASNLNLPKQVKGIISDCAFTSVKDQMSYTLKHNFKLPSFPMIDILNRAVKKKIGFDFNGETPLTCVKDSNVPMLFIHGEVDEMVPFHFVKELYDNCGSKKMLYTVPNANHAESGARDMDKYFKTITDFFVL